LPNNAPPRNRGFAQNAAAKNRDCSALNAPPKNNGCAAPKEKEAVEVSCRVLSGKVLQTNFQRAMEQN
jgi:hypothetical protein